MVTATQGFRHSSIPTAEKVIADLGEKSHAFTVEYVRGGKEGKEDVDVKAKMTPEALKGYDAVIFANTTGDLPLPDNQAFLEWIKSGKGFVGMHSASDTLHGSPAFIDMIGGEFLNHPSGTYDVEAVNLDKECPA